MKQLHGPISKIANRFNGVYIDHMYPDRLKRQIESPDPLEKETVIQYRRLRKQLDSEPAECKSYSPPYVNLIESLIPQYCLGWFNYNGYYQHSVPGKASLKVTRRIETDPATEKKKLKEHKYVQCAYVSPDELYLIILMQFDRKAEDELIYFDWVREYLPRIQKDLGLLEETKTFQYNTHFPMSYDPDVYFNDNNEELIINVPSVPKLSGVIKNAK